MNKKFLQLLPVVLFLVCSTAEGADWIFYGESNLGTYYYDKKGMKQLSGNLRQVWIKIVPTREGATNLKKKYPAVKGADKISVDMFLAEVNCSARLFRLLKGSSYDSSGHKITSFDYNESGESKWEGIIADSITGILYQAVCK